MERIEDCDFSDTGSIPVVGAKLSPVSSAERI